MGSPFLAARIALRAFSRLSLRPKCGSETFHGPWSEEASIQPSKRWKYSSPESAFRTMALVLMIRCRSVPDCGLKTGWPSISTSTAGTLENRICGGAWLRGRDSPCAFAATMPRSASSRSREMAFERLEGSSSWSVSVQAAAFCGAEGKLERVMVRSSR